MKNMAAERMLLASISEDGVREALRGVEAEGIRILLDGFKRYRCARKLGMGIVPYFSLGADEGVAIIQMLRSANTKNLNILEQARFIEELRTVHKMCVLEIANLLQKSKSWVSMRSGLVSRMSECVMEKIFNGGFPAYAYMYILRRFIRMNRVRQEEIDEFVTAVSGKNLSFRDIESLANGFFQGGDEFREHIRRGDIDWGLKRMKESLPNSANYNEFERAMLRDLEITKKYMQRVSYNSRDGRLKSNSFYAEANLLAGCILKQIEGFSKAIGDLYDRSGKA
jgi:hypothetical protein